MMGGILGALFNREVRAKDPLYDGYYVDGGAGIFELISSSNSGVLVTSDNSLACSAVYACVKVLSETIASLPLHVYERLPGGGKRRAANHPLYNLLHLQPNPEMSSYDWRLGMMYWLLLHGNAYSFIEYANSGRVKAIWLLRSDKISPQRNENNEIEYIYHFNSGEKRVINSRNILHIKGLSKDGLVGLNPIAQAREAIGLSLAAQKFGSKFFANGLKPSAVLKHPGVLGEKARKNLEQSILKGYTGLDNAHKFLILEEGLDLQEITIAPEDAQFLESRKFQVEEIARIFRVPPHMIASLDRATFSNIEHQGIEFVVYSLRPHLVNIEQQYTIKLFSPQERQRYFAEHLVDGLLRGDRESRSKALQTELMHGALNPNEWREIENRNPYEGGDVYYVPVNLMPVSSGAGSASAQDSIELRRLRQRRAAADRLSLRSTWKPLFRRDAQRVVHREVVDIKRAIDKILKKRGVDEFKLWLGKFYDDHVEYLNKNLMPLFSSYADAVSSVAIKEVSQDIKSLRQADNVDVLDFTAKYTDAYIKRHIGSSIGQLNKLIDETPGDELADVLDERLTEWDDTRAEKIASNETVRLGDAIARYAWMALGITTLVWMAAGAKPCPYCQELDGSVVGITGSFVNEGDELNPEGAENPMQVFSNISHAPLHQGCECTVVPGI